MGADTNSENEREPLVETLMKEQSTVIKHLPEVGRLPSRGILGRYKL